MQSSAVAVQDQGRDRDAQQSRAEGGAQGAGAAGAQGDHAEAEEALREMRAGITTNIRFNAVVETGVPGFIPRPQQTGASR